jgi:hypothetical protein
MAAGQFTAPSPAACPQKKRPAEAGRSHAEVGKVWWRNGRPARGRVFSVGRIGCNRYATNLLKMLVERKSRGLHQQDPQQEHRK